MTILEETPRVRFDWTISFGHILTVASVGLALATAYTAYQVTINDHDSRIRALEKTSLTLDARTNEIASVMYSIRQDLAIIKYRMERDDSKGSSPR